MRIIGIAGKAGVGKDTAADHLVSNHGFIRYGFADPMKAMLAVIGVDATDRNTKELPHPLLVASPRQMAQELGTAWMRERVHLDGWLILAGEFMDKTLWSWVRSGKVGPEPAFVISDVRFENEAQWIRAQGGIIWHMVRQNAASVREHKSEKGIEYVYCRDQTLKNFHDLPILYSRIDLLLAETYAQDQVL